MHVEANTDPGDDGPNTGPASVKCSDGKITIENVLHLYTGAMPDTQLFNYYEFGYS